MTILKMTSERGMNDYTFSDWLHDLMDVPLGAWLFWALMIFLLVIGS